MSARGRSTLRRRAQTETTIPARSGTPATTSEVRALRTSSSWKGPSSRRTSTAPRTSEASEWQPTHSGCFGMGTKTESMPCPEEETVRFCSMALIRAARPTSDRPRSGLDVTHGVPARRYTVTASIRRPSSTFRTDRRMSSGALFSMLTSRLSSAVRATTSPASIHCRSRRPVTRRAMTARAMAAAAPSSTAIQSITLASRRTGHPLPWLLQRIARVHG
ncbi:hypothetical protein HRbin12_00069 [bacterium HR12]|nr:hypothetical protein HRbin12_00069 [bacterium HR12]